mmetsp:Transcript_11952/g.19382  ORF Transcript_11952/g.19382 Transcript_11952/m.19382 type:complete len:103 (-) Transcript_11952:128-436(-)
MPLHHACSKVAPDGVMETLVRLGPKAAQSKDDNRLPLHVACKKGITKHALTIFLQLQVYARGAAVGVIGCPSRIHPRMCCLQIDPPRRGMPAEERSEHGPHH